jgi:AraC family transcriptional regulator of adaptative response/methylated-DNA-[protein]-cysteine methyltransferase
MVLLYRMTIATPLGGMVAVADDKALYLLVFADDVAVEKKIEQLIHATGGQIVTGSCAVLVGLERELKSYFLGTLTEFTTPVSLVGTDFQCGVWQNLQKIVYGKTDSYESLARIVGKPSAFRAVALANAANRLAIIIPCHRVIAKNGSLSGYRGGIARKRWLIDHESKVMSS